MSRRWRSFLLAPALLAALAGTPFAGTARAQCAHGGGPGSRGGPRQQMMLQLQLQQQLQFLQRLQQQKTAELDRQVRELVEQGPEAIAAALKDKKADLRFVAALAAGQLGPSLTNELLDRLTDPSATVRQAVRSSLVRISNELKDATGKPVARRRIDFGPAPDANRAAQNSAARRWRAWFAQSVARAADSKPAPSPAPEAIPVVAGGKKPAPKSPGP